MDGYVISDITYIPSDIMVELSYCIELIMQQGFFFILDLSNLLEFEKKGFYKWSMPKIMDVFA